MSEQNRQCSDTGCDKTSCESCDHANTAINFSAPLHEMSTVKKVIGIVSGKGGVGKSIVTSLLAAAMQKAGKKTAVLDADITYSATECLGFCDNFYKTIIYAKKPV